MGRGIHRLTALQVRNAKPNSRLSDGGGLRLQVDGLGNRSWIFRFTSPATGRERYQGLGSLDAVPLAAARELAAAARETVARGVDPIDQRDAAKAAARKATAPAVSFQLYAEQFIGAREATWKNPAHRQQWRNTLRDYAYPIIGAQPVADVDTAGVLAVLRPIWTDKPETASRIRGRIEVILSAAKSEGLRSGENPATWRGHLDQLLPHQKRVRRVVNHPALPIAELPVFWQRLVKDQSAASRLLRFLILTAARFNEGAAATFAEVDRVKRIWTVPAVRMKGGRAHRAPLTDAALALVPVQGSGLIFASPQTGKTLSDVAVSKCLRRHTSSPATTHGMRSAFRDWAGDHTDHPREVIEAALAHAIGDATEAAYRRGDALEKRRALMEAWESYVTCLA